MNRFLFLFAALVFIGIVGCGESGSEARAPGKFAPAPENPEFTGSEGQGPAKIQK